MSIPLFDHFVTTVERVGIPLATAAMGAYVLYVSPGSPITVLPYVGTALILAALATYVWLTARTTVKVPSPPAPLAPEVVALLAWMQKEISMQNQWARSLPPPPREPSPD
jgi:hypothetical protein